MKAKLIGLIVLILVIAGAVGYTYYQKNSRTEQISGYVGGEKIGLLEDEEVKKILRSKYHLTVNYYKAGSLDMVTADKTGKDYLFPSSQTALELYEEKFGKPEKSEIILNTPIVIYTHKAVADALTQQGIVSSSGDVSYVDMQKLLACIENICNNFQPVLFKACLNRIKIKRCDIRLAYKKYLRRFGNRFLYERTCALNKSCSDHNIVLSGGFYMYSLITHVCLLLPSSYCRHQASR